MVLITACDLGHTIPDPMTNQGPIVTVWHSLILRGALDCYLPLTNLSQADKEMSISVRENSPHVGNTLLLLSTQGRYSGQKESNLMVYRRDNNDYVVAATNESERFKPGWYLNLKEEPVVMIEIGGIQIHAMATTPVGRERLRLWPLVEEISSITREVLPRDTAIVVLSPMC